MLEIKLSQAARPGHGGVLPAAKNTADIGKIRIVEVSTEVISPSTHREFNSPVRLLEFVKKPRELSDGKPVGFKLCVGLSGISRTYGFARARPTSTG
jgi:glutamate synthase domain-containing protein 2